MGSYSVYSLFEIFLNVSIGNASVAGYPYANEMVSLAVMARLAFSRNGEPVRCAIRDANVNVVVLMSVILYSDLRLRYAPTVVCSIDAYAFSSWLVKRDRNSRVR